MCRGLLPLPQFDVVGPDVFDQFKGPNGVRHPAVDAELVPGKRKENSGMATSMAAFYSAKLHALSPAVGMADISIADIIIYAGALAMARCEGPHVVFVPGRKDASVADPDDLLPMPPPEDDFHHVLMYFLHQGLSELDAVVLLASHTTACFSQGCLDNTPTKFDNNWAAEILAYATNKNGIPECQEGKHGPAVARCKATMDTTWLEHDATRQFLQLLLNPAKTPGALTIAVSTVVNALGMKNFQGINMRANLCTFASCPSYQDQYAIFNLFASSWYRMFSNNIPANL